MFRRIGACRKFVGLAGLGLLMAAGPSAQAADPAADPAANRDVLWTIVRDRCMPGQRDHADPAPCAAVDVSHGEADGFAVLKDLNGRAQFLLIPTGRASGIDDPAMLAPEAPNYFDAAWDARGFVAKALGRPLPRDGVGLVINSVAGRTQEQMHIHIDCLRGDVREALQVHRAAIGPGWAPFPVPLAGRGYLAMRVSGERLGASNPLKLLASGVPGAAAAMGAHTLIVTGSGADEAPGFVLLDRLVRPEMGDTGHGTELLDRTCGDGS